MKTIKYLVAIALVACSSATSLKAQDEITNIFKYSIVSKVTAYIALGSNLGDRISHLRATAVVKYLVTEKGLDPSRFSASGYGEYQPLVPNISEANRRINRRVDIVIMKLD